MHEKFGRFFKSQTFRSKSVFNFEEAANQGCGENGTTSLTSVSPIFLFQDEMLHNPEFARNVCFEFGPALANLTLDLWRQVHRARCRDDSVVALVGSLRLRGNLVFVAAWRRHPQRGVRPLRLRTSWLPQMVLRAFRPLDSGLQVV